MLQVYLNYLCLSDSAGWNKRSWRFHFLSTAHKEGYRKWSVQGCDWLHHFRSYFFVKFCRHLCRCSGTFERTQERLQSWSEASCTSRKLYTLHHSYTRFSITWPSITHVYCATRGRKIHELCEDSPFELLPIYCIVLGNAGKPQLTYIAFKCNVVINMKTAFKGTVVIKMQIC